MRRGLLGSILLAALVAPASLPGPAARPGADRRPSLVVVLVIEQLPSGTLEAMRDRFSGGLKRFLEHARRFPRCDHHHAVTETGPGHATLLSGLYPAHNGIVTNEWYDPIRRVDVYCVGDTRPEAGPGFDGSRPVTGDLLRGESLGDLLDRASPGSKVFTVTGKDRSAVLTAGRHPDGAFWFSSRTGGFTSHPAIVAQLPAWGSDFWDPAGFTGPPYRDGIPEQWIYPLRDGAVPDDYPFEYSTFSRAAPHPLLKPDPAESAGSRVETIAKRIQASPWMDWLTLKLAERILEAERLGADAAPDLLVVSLAGIDYVGHYYGPGSQEYLDTLVRIDGWLTGFMRRAEATSEGRALFVLTSDHGTLPIPETLPGARRIDREVVLRRLEQGLAIRLGKDGTPAKGPFIASEQTGNLYLDRVTLERLDIPLEKAIEEARRELTGFWEVARVYRRSDLAPGASGTDLFLDLHRSAFDPDRSGDLVIQPCDRCLFTGRAEGTSHGSPYEYDRLVPMFFLGSVLGHGEDAGSCRTVDLAPSLAALLGLSFEAPRDGRNLFGSAQVDRPPARK